MQALVLAGGLGTRLQPLTLSVPKPILPLAGRPFLTFMLDWLGRHGVDEAILSCGFMADAVADVLGDGYEGIALRYVVEDDALGTAGPVRLAADEGLVSGRLLVLNGDILADLDLTAQVAEHERRGALATLALVEVTDTTGYGVVTTADDGRILEFREKDPDPPTKRINAGAYVLEPEAIERILPGGEVSFEREVFPGLVRDGALYGFMAAGYWLDIGTPERYLEATGDLLTGRVESSLPPRDETGSLVADGCVTAGARVGPISVLGRHCLIGSDASIERSVLHDDVRVGAGATVTGAVLAQGVRVGERAEIDEGAIVGAGARVAPGARVERDARVEPEARVGDGQPVGP